MGLHPRGWLSWITFFGFSWLVCGLSRKDLFQYGALVGDRLLEQGNNKSQELVLDKPVFFYNGTFRRVYINTNGFIATSQPADESEVRGKTPTSFGIMAALKGDLNTSDGVGRVCFRQDSKPITLRWAARHINRAFPNENEVQLSHAVVVTWENIAFHKFNGEKVGLENKRNTFQMVIASSSKMSYAILLYPKEGMQFLSTPVEFGSEPMHAGFSQGPEKFLNSERPPYLITTSDERSVRELSEQTNSGKRGVWVFKIGMRSSFPGIIPGQITDPFSEVPEEKTEGRPKKAAQVLKKRSVNPLGQQQIKYPSYEAHREDTQQVSYGEPPPVHQVQFHHPRYHPENPQVVVIEDGEINVDVFSYNVERCANNRHKCSNFAVCRDYPSGYCCSCRSGFYGNGKQCVAEGAPQRMNGKVNGRVFVGNSQTPVELQNNDLHAYVVAKDGRAFVAISNIPNNLGPSLLPVSSLAGAIGWAFAFEQPGYENGFSIVGGEFTRQAEVTFLPRNERLIIRQSFQGIDEHDHLVVSTELDGRVPEVPQGATVQFEPYFEIYQHSSNLITSSSTREYTVKMDDGPTETHTFQWRQTISFEGCPHDEASRVMLPAQELNVHQVFVMYDVGTHIIRFAMSNKIGAIHDAEPQQNPCFTGQHHCDTNAVCRPGRGAQFTCECAGGFTGDGRVCYDVDECRETPHVCHRYGFCTNQPGTFRCQCHDGYHFDSDGHTCIEADHPVDHCQAGTHNCDVQERAQCSYIGGSSFYCSCLPGFHGDGHTCRDIDECQQGRCHQDAICYNTQGSFTCRCRQGFYGDGFYCSAEREKTLCERHRENLLGSYGPRGPRPPMGQYIPECDEAGNYKPVQCHGSTGQCWCVDRNGVEIHGTRTRPGSTPMCTETSTMPPVVGPTTRPDVNPPPPGTHLLFAQSGKIEHIPLDGYNMKKDEAKAVLHLPEKVVIGVAYDCVDKMVYWTDIAFPSISKANLQGGEPITVIRTDLQSPEGIAIDHLGRTMFWTDSMQDRIEVASLDGSQRRVLIDTGLVNPRAIIADPAHGHLYWADWNRDAPKIETSYMDGTNRRVLVKDNLGLPNGLTFDPHSSLLCWADAGTHKVECMNPSYSDRRKVLEGIQYPFSITAYGEKLYYTDWRRNAVVMVDGSAGTETDDFQPKKQSRLYGITTAYAQCPSGHNYCAVNNGRCSHLCLATPSGRSCLCPDNAIGVGCVERHFRH